MMLILWHCQGPRGKPEAAAFEALHGMCKQLIKQKGQETCMLLMPAA